MIVSRLTLVLHLFLAVVLSGQLTFHGGKSSGIDYFASSEAAVVAVSEYEQCDPLDEGLPTAQRAALPSRPPILLPSKPDHIAAVGILELRATGPPIS